ncbi:MAG: TetR/AcrR family transcriptional regulator [Candidatus Delongbacteria bacterium]|nr:TetR/AcrR family transcriptional regulator [Candidatus Delongbacteria bacterium]
MGKEEVKRKIIQTTIECIEQEGIQGATIRKIADLAGVNVAAINYHFGSKEQLFKIVMNATLNESFVQNINDYKEMWQSDTKKALQLFFEDTLEGAINYPNITKAHLADTFNKSDYNTNTVYRLNDFLTTLHNLVKLELRSETEIESKIAVSQLFASILMFGMMPDLLNEFLNFDLKNKENQQIFVQTLLNNFCK